MTLDPSIPARLVTPTTEDDHAYEDYEPRASLLLTPSIESLRTELWMGGVHSALGDPVTSTRGAWVVDCAGELPPDLAQEAARHIPRVFADIEAVPGNLARIHALVEELVEAMRGPEAPARVYVMCKQGLNRSGLVSALLLTALGTPSDEAVETVRAVRPGALNNVTFERLVRGE